MQHGTVHCRKHIESMRSEHRNDTVVHLKGVSLERQFDAPALRAINLEHEQIQTAADNHSTFCWSERCNAVWCLPRPCDCPHQASPPSMPQATSWAFAVDVIV